MGRLERRRKNFPRKKIDIVLACDADLNETWQACAEKQGLRPSPRERISVKEALLSGATEKIEEKKDKILFSDN
jgi:hypothetical protein